MNTQFTMKDYPNTASAIPPFVSHRLHVYIYTYVHLNVRLPLLLHFLDTMTSTDPVEKVLETCASLPFLELLFTGEIFPLP